MTPAQIAEALGRARQHLADNQPVLADRVLAALKEALDAQRKKP